MNTFEVQTFWQLFIYTEPSSFSYCQCPILNVWQDPSLTVPSGK